MTIQFQPFGTQHGWECPKCGSVYAPWMAQCSRCPQQTFTMGGNVAPVGCTCGLSAGGFCPLHGSNTCEVPPAGRD